MSIILWIVLGIAGILLFALFILCLLKCGADDDETRNAAYEQWEREHHA